MITFLAAQGRRLDRAQPDGNCLFRSLSKQLFESDVYHGELRMILSEYAASYPDLFSSWTIQDLSLQEHVRKIKEPRVWGSHLEITVAATLFQKNIYVASDSLVLGKCQWTSFSPLSTPEPPTPILRSLNLPTTNNKEWLEIAHSNQCHYDAIYTDICTPPILTGKTTFVTEVL